MKTKIANWVADLENNTQLFKQHFAGLSPEDLNWKPDPQTWSIAQNIDHLITINSTYFPVLDKIQAGRYEPPWLAKIGFIPRLMGNLIYNASLPDRRKKMKTFPLWEPAQSMVDEMILQRFEAHQKTMADYIQKAAPAVERGQVISSPAQASLVYKLARAFDIIVVHEQRHLEQAKEVQMARQAV
ncbi:MAG: DinB family protein [Saprospiraceae bacterium]|nr:DinB family protein [Saprospiraceae bacterium]